MNNLDENCRFLQIAELQASMVNNTIPETSKKRYEDYYEKFMIWRQKNNVQTFSENVLLAYFGELSKKYKSSSLWTVYSMLQSTINMKHNVSIKHYSKLKCLLKKASENYQAKKSKTLTAAEIHKFIKEAPDKKFLLIKVALVIALTGSCGRNELCRVKVEDIEDLNSVYLIKIPDPKTKTVRTYTITGQFYEMCKRYFSLRPPNCRENRFFLNYQNGKCTCQVVGINKLGAMPKQIATFLNLPNPEEYTGHCFRRSSATLLKDSSSDLLLLKLHGGWFSSTLAEGKQLLQGHANSGSTQIPDRVTQQNQPKFRETSSTIKDDPLSIDPLNIASASKNLCASQDSARVKEEPAFVDIDQETDEDQPMEIVESETEDGVRVKEETDQDKVTQIYLESSTEDLNAHNANGVDHEIDTDNLDFIDLMFLEFSKKFKHFSARTQIKVRSRICRIMTEAEMDDVEERR